MDLSFYTFFQNSLNSIILGFFYSLVRFLFVSAKICLLITRGYWRIIMNNIFKAVLLLSFLSIGLIQGTHASEEKNIEDYMPSLITKTPLEGRMLAIKIVRKTIGTIQRDPEIKRAVRKKYQDDPQLLMYAAELVAIEFKTIAIANNYWREI